MAVKRIKVLQVIGALNRGGAETVVINLCNNVDPGRFDLQICSLADSVPMASRLVHPKEVKITTCGRLPGIPPLKNQLSVAVRLSKLVRRWKPDIIHSHLYSFNAPLQWLCGLGQGCKHVVTIHNTGMHYGREKHWPSAVFRWCETFNIRLTGARVIAVSKAVAEVVRKRLHVPDARLHIIYDGVDTEIFSRPSTQRVARESVGCTDGDMLVINVAGLHAQKGHKYLIDAWPKVVFEVPNAKLLLAGDGNLRDSLKSQAGKLGVSESIKFLGLRDDVEELLAISDVGVFPSLYEGLGLALVEMMSMQLPVVGSYIPPLLEVVSPGECGLLVPPAEPQPLAKALIRLLKDGRLRQEMGTRARKRVENLFSVQKQALEHERLYEYLVFEQPRKSSIVN